MNAQLLNLGDCIVNLAHVVKAEYEPAIPGGTYFDEDYGKELERRAFPAVVKLTLVSVEKDTEHSYEGDILGVGTKSQTKKIIGDLAERVWDHLCKQAVGLAPTPEPA